MFLNFGDCGDCPRIRTHMLRRSWTPHEADEWTREDYWAILFSSLAYFLIMVGTALLFLLPVWGIVITAAGTVSAFVMYWIIDPKLRTKIGRASCRERV